MDKVTFPLISETLGHKLNADMKYEEYISDVLHGKKLIQITHTLSTKPISRFTSSSRLLDLSKRQKYERRTFDYKPALHWGQLKLFLSEVEFLTKVMQISNNAEIWFVYAGAAPGHHIKFLSDLFPKVHFELYDPNKFVIKDSNRIKTHVQFFMNEDAKYWAEQSKSKFIVFCSDIRTEPATHENIIRNMSMQLEWWKMINPELSMFKFRLPWEAGKTEYPDGEIYLQAYPGPTSSETRLICKKNAELKMYDNTEYEDACFYHNLETRSLRYQTSLGNLVLSRDGLDMCYDCASFIYIMQEYLVIMNLPMTGLRKLLNDVQQEISFGRGTVLSHSIKYFSESLTTLSKLAYIPCNYNRCTVCTSGHQFVDSSKKTISKATIENESLQRKKGGVLQASSLSATS